MPLTKRVSSGEYIDLSHLTEDDIDLADIERALNYIYRFTGHWKDHPPLTVAQHTLLTMNIADVLFPNDKAVKYDCLLHDMPEAYYGDIATPLKKNFGDTYTRYVNKVDTVVYATLWNIKEAFTEEVYSKRKICDGISLDIERRVMWRDQRGKDHWPPVEVNIGNMSLKEEMFHEVAKQKYVELSHLYNKMTFEN